MKKIIFLTIIILFTAGMYSFALDDDYDPGLFDVPEDIETEDPGTFGEEEFSLYGYLVNFLAADLIFTGSEFDTSFVGNVSYLRVKGDWNPGDNLSFHAELSYDAKFGNQNPYLIMQEYGILPDGYQSSFPEEDFFQSFTFDHFYGTMSIWKLDVQFGKMPVAWGTGYLFNPTQKVSSIPFMDTVTEETPGTYALSPSFSITSGWALETYLAFQDKSHKTTAVVQDRYWENLPWGIKLKGYIGSFDLSASLIKEVMYGGNPPSFTRSYYIGTDFAGGIWDIGVYGEAAFHMPLDDDNTGLDFSDREFTDLLEACLGFYYTIPVIETDMRGEYYHQGSGVTDKDEYNIVDVLFGRKMLLGKDYLFFSLEKLIFDFYTISVGAFFNLNDGSSALFPSIRYDMYNNFQVELGSTLFFGSKGSEFYGEYDLSFMGHDVIDLVQPMVYLKCKLSF